MSVLRYQLAQRGATYQLLHQVALGLIRVRYVVHFDDVRVFDLGHRARLAHEARCDLFVLAQMMMDDLDRHLTTEPPIASAVHGGHSAMANLFDELVLFELGATPGECC